MNYEKVQAYLAGLLAKFISDSDIEPDDDDVSLEEDFEERQDLDTDMKEDVDDKREEAPKVLNVSQSATFRWKRRKN